MQHLNTGILSLILGALTLIVMAGTPKILSTISPEKSIGQVIGENALDLLDAINKKEGSRSKEEIRYAKWSSGLEILSFCLLALCVVFASVSLSRNEKKILGIGALVLCGIGLIFKFTYLTIGLVVLALIVIGIIAVLGILGFDG